MEEPEIIHAGQLLNVNATVVKGWRLTVTAFGHEATFDCMMPDFECAASYARARFMKTIDETVSETTISGRSML